MHERKSKNFGRAFQCTNTCAHCDVVRYSTCEDKTHYGKCKGECDRDCLHLGEASRANRGMGKMEIGRLSEGPNLG